MRYAKSDRVTKKKQEMLLKTLLRYTPGVEMLLTRTLAQLDHAAVLPRPRVALLQLAQLSVSVYAAIWFLPVRTCSALLTRDTNGSLTIVGPLARLITTPKSSASNERDNA